MSSLKFYTLIALTICMGVLMDLQNLVGISANQTQLHVLSQSAQPANCDTDILTIMEQIEQLCQALGQNEVCYGNRQVEAIPFDDVLDLQFNVPGDLLPLNEVQSLRLSTLDLNNSLWGVAQLRLLLADFRNLQDVELLLFGDVYIEDTASSDDLITMTSRVVASSPINLRNLPDLSGLIVTTAQPDQELLAIARSVDGAWILVEDVLMGYQGWVFSDLIAPSDEAQSFDALFISEDSYGYWRPMQAFMFQSGDNASCGDTITDGMLIQTENGLSRITLLINEVVVELLPSGNQQRAQALLQSNPTNGMNINMLQGQAQVTVNDVTYNVAPNMALNIPLDQNGVPSGTASVQNTSLTQNNIAWLGISVGIPMPIIGGDVASQVPDNQVGNNPPTTDNNPPTTGNNPPTTGNNPPPTNVSNPPPTSTDSNVPDTTPAPTENNNGNPPPHAGTPGPPPHAGTPGPPPHSNGGGNKP